MTPQQLAAITTPCREAMECTKPQYGQVTRNGPYFVSVILTANIGYE